MSQAAGAVQRPPLDLKSWFFGFNGRINRARYWLGILFMIVVLLALVFLLVLAIPAFPLAIIAVGLVGLWIAVALAAKRLHDRNKSGWWAVLFIIVPGILDRLSNRLEEGSAFWWVILVVAVALSLWGLIEIGILRGTSGDNEYGPDPLAGRVTDNG